MGTITTANASVILAIPDVYPTPQLLSGYATDDMFTHDSFKMTEQRMGVDGILSAGFTPNPKVIHITFQADSPSIQVFEDWGAAHEAAQEALPGTLSIALPSTGKLFVCTTGWLDDYKKLPDAKKVQEPQTYSIVFQNITVTPL